MGIFEIDKHAIKMCWESRQKMFSIKDYSIKGSKELAELDVPEDINRSTYMLSIGLIPFVSVSDVEVMRAYSQTIKNIKLRDAISKIPDEEFEEKFWGYCDIYSELSAGYQDFETNYVVEKIKGWCEDNAIKYVIK